MDSSVENETDYLMSIFNDCDLMRSQLQYLSDPFYKEPDKRTFITALYSTVAFVGALGNLMVIAAVLRNAQMRTPRNYFIINLALSDLLMCVLTVPFTMYYVLNQFWDLGSTACKIVASAQGVNIFVSTMSITAIGLDRYWVILFPTKTQQQRCVIAVCFSVIWIASFLLASPLFYATDATLPPELKDAADGCGILLYVCSENWEGMIIDKGAYSISSTVFQYFLPLAMLTFAYTRIIWRLENRMVHRQRAIVSASQRENSTCSNNPVQYNRRVVEQRQRRMNLLLICLVAFFAICWLPLNVYNGLASFELAQYNVVVFVTCHAFGMTSACANPILYGVFNENFRTEFVAILTFLKITPLYRYLIKRVTGDQRRNAVDDEDNCPTMTATTKIADRFSHSMINETVSAPARQPNRKTSEHNQRPRIARFKKFKETDPEVASMTGTLFTGDSGSTKTSTLISPSENGCHALAGFQPTCNTAKNGSGNGKKEDGQKGKSAVPGNLSSVTSDKPGHDVGCEGRRVSEEKIPLFYGKAMVSGGNIKSYMVNSDL